MDGPEKSAELEFLGTGTSSGVPVPTCRCAVCRSADPRDRRWRSSVAVRSGGRVLVVDTTPEFRLQCLRSGLSGLDAVLLTHAHADHTNGLDDVRAFTLDLPGTSRSGAAIPVWGDARTLGALRLRFDYIWNAQQTGGGLPRVELREATGGEAFATAGMWITPIPVRHGLLDIFGYRIGDLAYLTDISALPESSLPHLEGVEVMVASCAVRFRHETHFSLSEVIDLHHRVKPRLTLITHISHSFSHQGLLDELPEGMRPAHDGLKVRIRL